MTGERWAPAAVAPTTASFGLAPVTTQALVADPNAKRLRACEVLDALPPLIRCTVGA